MTTLMTRAALYTLAATLTALVLAACNGADALYP